MSPLLGLIAATIIGAFFAWSHLLSRTTPSQTSLTPEPPCAPGCLPLIGHTIGLIREGFDYFVNLRKLISTPIFTIYVPGQKMYIVTDPSYVPAIEKQHKVLAFGPIEALSSARLLATTPDAKRKLMEDTMSEDGLTADGREAIVAAMRPGAILDEMNRVTMEQMSLAMNELHKEVAQGGKEIGLFDWTRRILTSITTCSLFGPENPFLDTAVFDAFWEFEKGIIGILLSPFPSITHRAAYAARERCTKAFEPYISGEHYMQGSAMIQNRITGHRKHGVTGIRDIARFELGPCLAALGNTPQAAFWTLLHIYQDPKLLDEVRAEVENAARAESIDPVKRTVNITTLKQQSPVLLSTFQESLRYHTMGTSVRQVLEDTDLNGWRLQKGALLQIPSRVFHMDEANYGTTAAKFSPKRFAALSEGELSGSKKIARDRDVCFRSFGGGKTLCPGRHFATDEVLALVALFVSMFDMMPVQGEELDLPTAKNTNPAVFVMQPDSDPLVHLRVRNLGSKKQWAVEVR